MSKFGVGGLVGVIVGSGPGGGSGLSAEAQEALRKAQEAAAAAANAQNGDTSDTTNTLNGNGSGTNQGGGGGGSPYGTPDGRPPKDGSFVPPGGGGGGQSPTGPGTFDARDWEKRLQLLGQRIYDLEKQDDAFNKQLLALDPCDPCDDIIIQRKLDALNDEQKFPKADMWDFDKDGGTVFPGDKKPLNYDNENDDKFGEYTKDGWTYANGKTPTINIVFNPKEKENVTKDHNYEPNRWWLDVLKEGGTKSGEPTKYTKTYTFYSSSIVNQNHFISQGFQESFPWQEHEWIYAHQETIYKTEQVYTLVGTDTHTHYVEQSIGGTVNGTFTTGPTVTNSYEWVTVEKDPVVTFIGVGYELFVPYGSIGVVAERDGFFPDGAEGSIRAANDEHSIESAYTDNPPPTYSLMDDDSVIGTTISKGEQDFWWSIFGTDDRTAQQILEDKIDFLCLQLFNSSRVSKFVFPKVDPETIINSDLQDLAGSEEQFLPNLTINKD